MIIDKSNIHYKEKQTVIGIINIHSCFRLRGTGEECRTCNIFIHKKENATCENLLNYLEKKWKSGQVDTGIFYEVVKLTIDAVKERIKDEKITFKTPALFMGYIKKIFRNKLDDIDTESGRPVVIVYFNRDDFNGVADEEIAGAIDILYKEIIKDFPHYNNFSQTGCKLKVLHNILESLSFYDEWQKKFPAVPLDQKTELLLSETARYRKSDQPFSQLGKWQKNKILTLNRLLLEQVYGLYCPKMQNFEIISFDYEVPDYCEVPDYRGKNPNALSDNEIDGINADNLWSILDENVRQGEIKDCVRFLKDEYRCMELNDYNEITDEELARGHGASAAVIRQRRSRAIKEIYKNSGVRKYLENLLDTPKLTEKIGHVFPEGRVKEKDIRGWCHIAVNSTTSGSITVLLRNENIPQGIKITKGMVLYNLRVDKIIKNKLYVKLCNELT